MRVPLGVVGQAVGVASFPFLAQLFSERRFDELDRTVNATLRALTLMLLPISALTMAESRPLVRLFFAHTRLTPSDLDATAATLVFFSLGMFAWGAQSIVARGFYAARDTLTPAVLGTLLTLLNIPVYWLLVRRMQHLGLALASSIGIVVYTMVLFAFLERRLPGYDGRPLLAFFAKISALAAIMGLGAWQTTNLLATSIGWTSIRGALAVLVLATLAGLAIGMILAWAFRVEELRSLLRKSRLTARPA
jgi:putative peptidoglycan lipid II flippase